MKKIVYGLFIMLMGVVLASCGGKKDIGNLINKLEDNKDMSKEDLMEIYEDYLKVEYAMQKDLFDIKKDEMDLMKKAKDLEEEKYGKYLDQKSDFMSALRKCKNFDQLDEDFEETLKKKVGLKELKEKEDDYKRELKL